MRVPPTPFLIPWLSVGSRTLYADREILINWKTQNWSKMKFTEIKFLPSVRIELGIENKLNYDKTKRIFMHAWACDPGIIPAILKGKPLNMYLFYICIIKTCIRERKTSLSKLFTYNFSSHFQSILFEQCLTLCYLQRFNKKPLRGNW